MTMIDRHAHDAGGRQVLECSIPPRFDALDSLRGLAALAVLIDHCLNLFPTFGGPVAGQPPPDVDSAVEILLRSPLSLAWNGRGAVAIFFVLSGFVLALPWLQGRPLRYPQFAVRRLCRIYLPYLVAVALAMMLAASVPATPARSRWFDRNWTEPVSLAVVVDHVLMLGAHNTFDNATWSLNHEIRISLVFPLLLWPLLRFGRAGAAVAAVGLYGLAGVITHTAGWEGAPAELAATIRFSTFFILGATLAQSAEWLRRRRSGHAAWLSLVIGLLLLWVSTEPAVMACGAGLVLLAAILPGRIAGALARALPRALGRISYSLYLVHLLVLLAAVHLLARYVSLPAIAVGGMVLSILVAVGFHRLVEAPADRLGRRLVRRVF